MTVVILVSLVFIVTFMSEMAAGQNTSMNTTEQEDYLRQYGYMDSEMSAEVMRLTNEKDKFKSAISSFQHMMGLNESGVMNNETMTMMMKPRCGIKDMVSMGSVAKRRKRYVASGSMWGKSRITYNFTGPLTNDLPMDVIKREIAKALQTWSDAVPGRLMFSESMGNADLMIRFAREDHGDGNSFDGPAEFWLTHSFLNTVVSILISLNNGRPAPVKVQTFCTWLYTNWDTRSDCITPTCQIP